MPFVPVDISSGYSPALDSASDGPQKVVNWRVVPGVGGGGVNVLRPAVASTGVSGLSAPVIGCFRFQTNLIVVTSDRYIYRIPDSGPTLAIPLSTSTTSTQLDGMARPTFAEDSAAVYIAGGGYISKWSTGSPTALQITAGSAPVQATHICALSGRLIANNRQTQATRNEFFWSDLGDGSHSSWQALSFATADARPDEVVGVYDNISELYVFGATTLQVYQTSSDALNPFSPVITANVGNGAAYAPVQLDTDFASITDDGRVIRTDGRSVTMVPAGIENLIRSFSTYSDAFGWRERVNQHDLLVYRFPTAGRTLEFDLNNNVWSERLVHDGSINNDTALSCYTYWPTLRQHWFGSSASASMYVTSTSATTDYPGYPVTAERITGRHNHGTIKRKRSRCVRAVMKRGTAGPSNNTPGYIEVRVEDDGRLGPWQRKSIGNDGDSAPTVDFYVGGVFYTRVYHIRYAGTSQTSLAALLDDVTELAG